MIFFAFTSIVWKSQDGRYEICALDSGRYQILVNGVGRVLERRIRESLIDAVNWCRWREDFVSRSAA